MNHPIKKCFLSCSLYIVCFIFCLLFPLTSQQSTNCLSGYYYNSSTFSCQNCLANCNVCANPLSCIRCFSGFAPSSDNSTCMSLTIINTISNCSTYGTDASGTTVCTMCNQYYGFKSNDPTKCVICSKSNNCTTYELDDFNNPICTSCPQQFYVYPTHCYPCKTSNCATCPRNSPLCNSCLNTSYYLDSANTCQFCSNAIQNCSTCASNTSCSSCNVGYYLSNNQCISCGSSITNCSVCSNASTCIQCNTGYFFNGTQCLACSIGNCSNCSSQSDSCTTCLPGFYINGTACQTCLSASSSLSNCLVCSVNPTSSSCSVCASNYYLNPNTQACVLCSSSMANCSTCSSSSYCTQCANSFQTLIDTQSTTCVASCANDGSQLSYNSNSSCVTCIEAFGCPTCNSTNCLTCPSSAPYLLMPLQIQCVPCNNSGDIQNKTTMTCTQSSSITVTVSNFIPFITINCAGPYNLYFAYGLYGSVDGFTLNDMEGLNGDSNLTPTRDKITWIGYGAFLGFKPVNSFYLSSPLKNSGDTYEIIAYCINSQNSDFTMKSSWIQPSNGANTSVLRLTSTTVVSSSNKFVLGVALKNVLKINRDIYTDDGTLISYTAVTTRLLQNSTNSSNTTTNSSNTNSSNTNSSNTTSNSSITYNVDFYIVPDYTLTFDNVNTVLNNAISNSTTFLVNLKTVLGSNASMFQISGANIAAMINAEPRPTFDQNIDNIVYGTNSLQMTLMVNNTNGFLYYGIEKTLANSTQNSYYNLTGPNLTQFLSGLNVNNASLLQYGVSPLVIGTNITITFSNLTSGTYYNIYFCASNENYPKVYTDLYGHYLSTNSTNSNSSSRLSLIVIFLIIIVGLLQIIG